MHQRSPVWAIMGLVLIAAALVALGVDLAPITGSTGVVMATAGAAALSAEDGLALANRMAAVVGQFNAKVAEIDERLAPVAELRARLTGVEQEVARRPGGGGHHGPSNTIGAALVSHPQFSALGSLAETRGKQTLRVKASITSAPTSGGALVAPDRADPVMMPRRRMTIRSLISPGTTNSNAVEYPKQTVRDLNPAIVSEGTLKPESNIAFELKNALVVTVAHWSKVSRQMLADAPGLRSMLDGELTYGVSLKEETEFLFGDGSSNHLHGIIPQAEEFDVTRLAGVPAVNSFDVLRAAIGQVEDALLQATGIVLNNRDLEAMQLIKDGQDRYIGGGPFGPAITSIWGRPVVGTPAMERGEFLVGAFLDGAQIWDREEVSVLVSTENENDFIHNMATVLCEERFAFAVRRPQAFVYGEFPITT